MYLLSSYRLSRPDAKRSTLDLKTHQAISSITQGTAFDKQIFILTDYVNKKFYNFMIIHHRAMRRSTDDELTSRSRLIPSEFPDQRLWLPGGDSTLLLNLLKW